MKIEWKERAVTDLRSKLDGVVGSKLRDVPLASTNSTHSAASPPGL